MVDIWKKYNSSKSYDEYFNLDNKLRKQAKTMSGILERYRIKKLNEIEKIVKALLTQEVLILKFILPTKDKTKKNGP